MNKKFEIPIKLPSLNDYIRACRANKYLANKIKSELEQQIGLYIIQMPKYNNPVKIHFTWIESNHRRDIDNVVFARKFILDSMVKYKKLKDDSRKYVVGFTDKVVYGLKNKVILEIEEML